MGQFLHVKMITPDKPVIASVSGGKDSTALCLWLKENNLPFVPVHMSTGWEHPDTEVYISEVLHGRW